MRAKNDRARDQRRAEAYRLRAEGLSYEKIGHTLGVTRFTVKKDLELFTHAQNASLGRYTLLNDSIHNRIIMGVESGVPLTAAAQAASVSPETVRKWIKRGNEATVRFDTTGRGSAREHPYIKLANAVNRALGVDVETRVKRINGHAVKDWKADRFMLETVHKDEFAPDPKQLAVQAAGDIYIDVIAEARKIVADDVNVSKSRSTLPPPDLISDATVVDDEDGEYQFPALEPEPVYGRTDPRKYLPAYNKSPDPESESESE